MDNFKPGSAVAFRFKLNKIQSDACDGLQKLLSNLRFARNLQEIIENLTLKDLNHVLFKCEQEEKDADPQGGVYNLEGYGNLKYAGLQVKWTWLFSFQGKRDFSDVINFVTYLK